MDKFQAKAMDYLLDQDFFDPLAREEDVLPGRHAYSHAIALSSAAKAYLVLGDEKYRRAMAYAWDPALPPRSSSPQAVGGRMSNLSNRITRQALCESRQHRRPL